MPTPYYQDSAVTIYHGDCRDILPRIDRADLLLTDPPYGLNRDHGMGGQGYDSSGKYPRNPRRYKGGWDSDRPTQESLALLLDRATDSIIWGANYFSDNLPRGSKWLVWNKEQFMPSYSDAELAFTTLPGASVKMFSYGANRHRAEEMRFHPTQKPVILMQWCIQFVPSARIILDPYAGSGSTGLAAKNLGKRAVLIDFDEEYCEIAAKRMAQEVLNFAA